jgi:hypothetical protein
MKRDSELIIGSAWLLPVCSVDSGSRGVMNHTEVPFVTGLSVTGSCSTCNVHTACNPTWVLGVTRWLLAVERLDDDITSGVTR